MYGNVFWVNEIADIGGVETFVYEVAKKYHDKDITVMYQTASPDQLARLRQYVRTIKWDGKPFECDTIITNYNTGICDYVTAKHYYGVIHADYTKIDWKPELHPKIEKYIAVSKAAADGFKIKTGLDSEVCYNPLEIVKPRKILRLISCTRLTKDKGGQRMKIFADRLTEAGIPFLWLVFTNSPPIFKHPNVVFLPARLDGVRDYVADNDYLVQLSDAEACSYSMLEALYADIPAIVTPFPAAQELGVINGKTGWILPFDMSDVPVWDIYNSIPSFNHIELKDRWGDFLADVKSSYQAERAAMFRVRATNAYRSQGVADSVLGRIPCEGEEFVVDGDRMAVLTGQNAFGAQFVEVVEKIGGKPKTEGGSEKNEKQNNQVAKGSGSKGVKNRSASGGRVHRNSGGNARG